MNRILLAPFSVVLNTQLAYSQYVGFSIYSQSCVTWSSGMLQTLEDIGVISEISDN
jgi:hypothetical protein